MPLEKQSLNNFLPDGFETLNQEGYKENFNEDKIKTGYEKDVPDIVSGPNLNNLIDVVGKNTNTLNNYVEYLNSMPINNVPTVNKAGQLDYVENNFLNKNQITNCILEAPNGVATYSGSTITVKSGIKVLIPFGKNEDGTLNNIEYTTDERVYTEQTSRSENTVITIAINNNGRINAYTNYFSQEENPNTPYTCWYKPSENNFYTSDGESNFSLARIVPIADYTSSNLQIKTLTPKQPFRAVDWNDYNTLNNNALLDSDKSTISGWGMPSNKSINLTLGASGTKYTAPANGWYVVDKQTTGTQYLYCINNSKGYGVEHQSPYSGAPIIILMPVLKGDVIQIGYNAGGNTRLFKFYYAQGEV